MQGFPSGDRPLGVVLGPSCPTLPRVQRGLGVSLSRSPSVGGGTSGLACAPAGSGCRTQRESDVAGWAPGACVPGRAAGPPRRRCLPAASGPGADVSLWNILRNNIGKDLSKVSMPVQLNEPLNTLQRLCEELEYSRLLDQASRTADPCERMVPRQLPAGPLLAAGLPPRAPQSLPAVGWHLPFSDPLPPSGISLPSPLQVYIAAFAVSAYSSTYHRAGCKPFNPVLGETYECERPDRGFRFISEQVWASWGPGAGKRRGFGGVGAWGRARGGRLCARRWAAWWWRKGLSAPGSPLPSVRADLTQGVLRGMF